MRKGYLGIDVGSVSTNLVVVDEQFTVLESLYLRTQGKPIEILQRGYASWRSIWMEWRSPRWYHGQWPTAGGRDGRGRCGEKRDYRPRVAASIVVPDVRTVLRSGTGLQDHHPPGWGCGGLRHEYSCAAGTGSFLDQQAARLGYPSRSSDPGSEGHEPGADRGPMYGLCGIGYDPQAADGTSRGGHCRGVM